MLGVQKVRASNYELRPIILTEVPRGHPQFLYANALTIIRHKRFLPNSVQFIVQSRATVSLRLA